MPEKTIKRRLIETEVHTAALALVGWYLMTPSRRDPLPHMTQPGRTYHDGARGAAGRLGSTSINPLGVPKLMASNVEPPGIVSHLPKRVEDRHFTYKVSSSRVHASVARELTKILRRMSRKQRVYTGLRVALPPLLTRGIVREFPIVDSLSIVRASRSADDH
jgi:hypothetical protein